MVCMLFPAEDDNQKKQDDDQEGGEEPAEDGMPPIDEAKMEKAMASMMKNSADKCWCTDCTDSKTTHTMDNKTQNMMKLSTYTCKRPE